jgi:MoxR-like ATPase
MVRIVEVHHPGLPKKLMERALERFYWLRENCDLRKPPSTSELIDWIAALKRSGMGAKHLKSGDVPFLGTLVKKETDLEEARSVIGGKRKPGRDARWR